MASNDGTGVVTRAWFMEGAKLEDVPYLLSEWFKLFEGAIQKRINGLRTGVQADSFSGCDSFTMPTPRLN